MICQHQDHLEHSSYCLPFEIFLEKGENIRKNNNEIIKEFKKKFKAINDGSKQILKNFLKKMSHICGALSQEIDRNAEREIKLLEEILRIDKQMCGDFNKFDESYESFKRNIKPHLENIKVEINIEKAQKILVTCQTSEKNFNELRDIEKTSKGFEDYLNKFFKDAEGILNNLYGMRPFREGNGEYVQKSQEGMEYPNHYDEVISAKEQISISKNQSEEEKNQDLFLGVSGKVRQTQKSEREKKEVNYDFSDFQKNEDESYGFLKVRSHKQVKSPKIHDVDKPQTPEAPKKGKLLNRK